MLVLVGGECSRLTEKVKDQNADPHLSSFSANILLLVSLETGTKRARDWVLINALRVTGALLRVSGPGAVSHKAIGFLYSLGFANLTQDRC